jgi:hypothetical protein
MIYIFVVLLNFSRKFLDYYFKIYLYPFYKLTDSSLTIINPIYADEKAPYAAKKFKNRK